MFKSLFTGYFSKIHLEGTSHPDHVTLTIESGVSHQLGLRHLTILHLMYVRLDTAGWGVLLNAPARVLWLVCVSVKESTSTPTPFQDSDPHPYLYVSVEYCTLCEMAGRMLTRALTAAPALKYLQISSTDLSNTEDEWRKAAPPSNLTHLRLWGVRPEDVSHSVIHWAKSGPKLKPNKWESENYESEGWRYIDELPILEGMWTSR